MNVFEHICIIFIYGCMGRNLVFDELIVYVKRDNEKSENEET